MGVGCADCGHLSRLLAGEETARLAAQYEKDAALAQVEEHSAARDALRQERDALAQQVAALDRDLDTLVTRIAAFAATLHPTVAAAINAQFSK